MRTSRSVTCLLTPLLAATASWAQDPKEAAASPRAHMATLELEDADAGPGVELEFRREGTGDIAPRGESCEGRLPCGALARAERLDQDEPAYALLVDADGDGSLAGEQRHVLRPDGSVEVDVRVPASKVAPRLRYQIHYSRWEPAAGRAGSEGMSAHARYRAEGRLEVGGQKALVVMLDLDADGEFDTADARGGSAICLDLDGDGRIGGLTERFMAGQVIRFAGRCLLVDLAGFDGGSLRFVETDVRLAEVGQAVPPFSLRTADDKTHATATIPGKLHVIDFWASWCAPCVAKLPKLKELAREVGDELVVTWFSIDASADTAKAREIAARLELPAERLVIGGKGSEDPVWQMFGSGPTVRMRVPTYALIDAAGTLRYLGSGGAELEELRAAIALARGR